MMFGYFWLEREPSSTPPPPAAKPEELQFHDDPYISHSKLGETDGFLRASKDDPVHPITQLIAQNREHWRRLLQRQSTTLAGAVEEYRRRYNRPPPKGFDQWWDFAKDRDVQLIDEYDKMNEDLAQFYALSPATVQKLQDEVGGRGGFTIRVKMDGPNVTSDLRSDFRINPFCNWLQKFTKYFDEPLLMHLNSNDEPYSGFLPSRIRQRLAEAAAKGEEVSLEEIDEIHLHLDGELSALGRTCPDDAPLVEHEHAKGSDTYPDPPLDTQVSFVNDTKLVGDPCYHPYLAKMHYSFSPGTVIDYGVRYPAPIFSFSKTHKETDIIIPSLEQFDDADPLKDPLAPWPLMYDRAVWRGGTKAGHWGDVYTNARRWKWNSQRIRLRLLQSNWTGTYTSVIAKTKSDSSGLLGTSLEDVGIEFSEVKAKDLVDDFLDIAFSEPSQCGEVCDLFDNLPYGPCGRIEEAESNKYRYVIDVDGNGWSGRYPRLLRSQQVVLKSTVIEQFNQDWIVPWVHYVPLSPSYKEILNIITYFTGEHKEEAYRIAQQGRDWRIKYWRQEDQDAYLLRLLMEWRRVTSLDRKSMDYRE